ncbi:ATP-binding protein [Ectothiorhodospira lacustris]|uniref:ATP-binding protein n=1 Tax=Ectothiorhodospira lacustris TaxID=2899127 RepID=UPI001EE89F4C|nr:ATP-binding protein [Ectothiorhodospira lacustris]MCG5510940.1 PAS domain S-box protein [Ectothiorhodospira lacustris]MCG5522672.1 PAS domain S-box protein [Ectothiorhodospira lacustris]
MPEDTLPQSSDTRARAAKAVKEGDIELVRQLMEENQLDLPGLLETLRVYQSELELQNRELRESQNLNQRLLDNYAAFLGGLPIAALVVDRYGLVLQANPAAEARFDFRLHSSRHVLLRRLVHPEDETKFNQTLLQAQAEGHASAHQITLLSGRGRGKPFPAELHIARLPGREDGPCEFSCAVVDLTEQARHEEALRIAHEQLREQEICYRIAADHSPDWDYWFHPEGRYVYVSPGCQDISGYPPKAFKDDPLLMERLLIPEHVEHWQRHLQEVKEGSESPHVCMEFSIRRADGELRHIEHQCLGIVDRDGRYLGRRGVNRDITARRKAETQVAHLTRLYSTRTAVNQAITRLEDEVRLLKTTARVAVKQGGFSACIFTTKARPGQPSRIWASHGLSSAQLAVIPTDALWESIRKHTWTFINEHPLICSNCNHPDIHVPARWRSWAINEQIQSCGHFPLFVGDELVAVASFLAAEPDHFTPQVIDLLKGVMEDLSHALRQMARERQRKAKEAEFQKQESETRAFTQAIIDSLIANICVLDASGTIVAVNRSWREYGRKGQAREERVSQGVNYLEVCDRAAAQGDEDARRIVEGIRRVIAGDLEVYEDEYRLDPQTHMIRVTPLDNTSVRQRHLVISHQDISDIKRNEVALVVAKEEAERANRAKSEFLSSMSHELRTPMNAVLGFAQLMEIDLTLNQEQQEYVQEILRGGRHLLQLINQVLDLATVESGRIELSLENVPLRELMDECIMLVRPLAQERQIRIHSRCPPYCVALADRMRLKQILINLLSNGIKYNRHAGLLEISGEDQPQGGGVTISVTDTGRGIAPDRLAELFEPFNRLDANALETEGTGIGLAISRRLAEVMGGSIDVDSRTDTGSTFRVHLPRGEWIDDSTLLPHQDGPVSRDPARQQPPRTILHIDDNPANIRLVAQILRRRGHLRLLNSPNPRFGLELAGAHQPDLILLDINMPDLDGYQVLRRLRANPATAGIPVMALTAFATHRDMERGRSEGFNAYLTKPLDVPQFLQILEKLLAQAPGDAPLPAPPRH